MSGIVEGGSGRLAPHLEGEFARIPIQPLPASEVGQTKTGEGR